MDRDYIEFVTQVQGEKQLEKLGGIVDELMKKAQEAGVNVDEFAESIKKLGKASKGDLPVYDSFIGKLKNIAGVAAIGMGMKKSVEVFVAFDDVVRRVKATTGATAEDMELLRYQAKQLGDTTSWSAKEAAEAQFEFAKAGFSNNEILAATPGILNTAKAAEMGLAEATEITAGALRMFGLDASKSTTVGDMLTKTASSTTTGVRDLAESLKYSGTGAQQFGLNLQQTLGILGKLGDMSLKGSSAGTALQAVFSTIQNKAKAKKLSLDLGIQLTEDGKYRNLLDIVKDLKAKTATMEKAQAESLISEIFGEQGSQAMNRMLKMEEQQLTELINNIGNSTGFAEKMAKEVDDGAGGAFRGLKSAVEGLAISIGAYLEPTVITLLHGTTEIVGVSMEFVDWLNSGSYAADAMSFALVALCTGYATYKAYLIGVTLWEKAQAIATGAKNLAMGAGNAIMLLVSAGHMIYMGVLGLLTGQISITTALTWGLNAAMMVLTGPVGLIIAAIAGAAAGFYFLYQRSKRFRDTIDPLIDKLKTLWEWVKKFKLVNNAIEATKAGIGKIKEMFNFGSQVKTKQEFETEIDKRTKKVQAGAGAVPEFNQGAGVNTDYLLFSDDKKTKKGRAKGSDTYKHNGYYLKGTKVINAATGNNYNSYSNKTSNNYNSSSINKEIYNSISNGVNNKKTLNNYNNSLTEIANKNEENKNYSSNNIYSNSITENNNVKTIDEKILEILISIKNTLKSTNKSSKIEFNISKNDKEDIINEVVKDLVIALDNI
ncbi:phage tail tape measure protein [Fusobacterium sp.]|uniref:phage tail tape measure protein n=1 Tax=Fusobacterium sp. TaxID=68766 RepID=UPI002E77B6D0|nr:phage tail tape measure protein [Fusobacterium sp.]MEE1477124.1 phage tail tape measure protein [Fusobacterium sp.]